MGRSACRPRMQAAYRPFTKPDRQHHDGHPTTTPPSAGSESGSRRMRQTEVGCGHAERDAPRQNYDVDAKFLELYGGGRGAGGGGAPRRGLDDDEIAALRDAARRDSMTESGGWGSGGGGRRGPQDSGRGVRVQVGHPDVATCHTAA